MGVVFKNVQVNSKCDHCLHGPNGPVKICP